MLVFSAISPHPPIVIPEIGKENLGQVINTIQALKKLNNILLKAKPDTIIIISPHGLIYPDAFCINLALKYQGNFNQFGDFVTNLEFKGDLELAHKIKDNLENLSDKFPLVLGNDPQLDHGTLVPLYYLTKDLDDSSIIPMGYSFLDYQTHFEFGQRLRQEIKKTNKKIAVIASGDLSHRLTIEAPAGYSPQGKVFDDKLIKLLKKKDIQSILELEPELIEQAGECGLRSIIILLGILEGTNYQPELLSYEGPFGVGYLVMNFNLG